jgi:hypothetical protein
MLTVKATPGMPVRAAAESEAPAMLAGSDRLQQEAGELPPPCVIASGMAPASSTARTHVNPLSY